MRIVHPPFIECLLAQSYTVNQADIADAHEYRSTLCIGEGNQGFNRGFIKAALEFHGLGFAATQPLVKGHQRNLFGSSGTRRNLPKRLEWRRKCKYLTLSSPANGPRSALPSPVR